MRPFKVLLGVALLASLITFFLTKVTGCGVQPAKRVGAPGPVTTITVNTTSVETSVETVVETSSETSTATGTDTGECDDVTWVDISPLVEEYCVGCHRQDRFDQYAVAKAQGAKLVARILLDSSDPRSMPQRAGFSTEERETFSAPWVDWQRAGFPEDCDVVTPPPTTRYWTHAQVEDVIDNDLDKLTEDQQRRSAYIVTTNLETAGDSRDWRGGVNKALNDISLEADVHTVVQVVKGVYRLDRRELGLTDERWELIEEADKLEIVSETSKGRFIQERTGLDTPWFHLGNFVEITQHDPDVYHALVEAPATAQEFLALRGVAFDADLQSGDAALVGVSNTTLAPQHNRLIIRHDSRDGYCYSTQDTGLQDRPERFLATFPLPLGSGGEAIFEPRAGEYICTAPNGGHLWYLSDAAGLRQDKVPVDIVRDAESPVTSEISIVTCARCHADGIIPRQDEIRVKVLSRADQFDRGDVDLVSKLYRPRAEMDRLFDRDNARYARYLNELGLELGQPDPVTLVSDRHELPWTLADLAAVLGLLVDETILCIDSSSEGRAQLSQLFTGSVVSLDQVAQVLPFLKLDCRLFKDPL